MLVYCSNNKTEKQHSLKIRYFIKNNLMETTVYTNVMGTAHMPLL